MRARRGGRALREEGARAGAVSTASPRWREARLAPALDGHKRLGEVDLQLHGALSTEPDYLTGAAGAKVAVDLRGRTVTPSLGYEFTHDTIGRAETTFATFSREVSRHALEVGLGLVLGRATYGSLGLRGVLELGDSSNPYRHVPVFHESIADLIQPGLSVDEVNYFRLPMRPLEQLPDGRGRLSVAAALAQRFGPSTLRLGERLYFDSWGVMATTSTGSFTYGVTKWLGLGPELGFHGQQGASFYRMVYPARESDEGFAMPRYRTSDRELGPLYTLSVGALARLGFGEPTRWGASLSGDVAYSKFLRHLFLVDRIAYLGALNLEVAFE
ncbi:MAG: DUF3570 domain-containing protein [Deltaproteobacteria bacterium]|nr:DUF3570 domain-containing protein [Deltaproteobacteria bacterium]